MTYLENIPNSANEYGLNKILTVRELSIDFKHKDTEIHLRSKHLLDNMNFEEYKNLMIYRSQQLRTIYNISRKVFNNLKPHEIIDLTTGLEYNQKHIGSIATEFININECMKYNYKITKNMIVYSTFVSQRDMILYFYKNKLELPKEFRKIREIKDIMNPRIIMSIVDSTLTHKQMTNLWVHNIHLFIYKNVGYSRFSIKTDIKI